MNQLFPTIYLSFDGFLRRQLKQELARAFNQSLLNSLGFKLHFSPRTVADFGIPDAQQVALQCKQAALFVSLVEEAPGHGSRQNMLHTELDYVNNEAGTKLLLLTQTSQPKLTQPVQRIIETSHKLVLLEEENTAKLMLAQIELFLLGSSDFRGLPPIPDNNSFSGRSAKDISTANEAMRDSELTRKLFAKEEAQSSSPVASNLQQYKEWVVSSLSIQNSIGAMASIQKALELNDSDLMANYWRCRLLVDCASKDIEFQELIRRGDIIEQLCPENSKDANELLAQSCYFKSVGYAGVKRLDKAQDEMERAIQFEHKASWLHQAALRALQVLAQEEHYPDRADPALIHAKHFFMALLADGLTSFQASFRELLLKTPRDKLELVMLGVKQEVIAALKQVKQHEQELLQICASRELIIPQSNVAELSHQVMNKSIWNLITIGRESIQRQVALLQVLGQKICQQHQTVIEGEQQANQCEQKQNRLSNSISQLQAHYSDAESASKLSISGAIGAACLSFFIASGFWWLPLNTLTIGILTATSIFGLVLLWLLFQAQKKKVSHVLAQCRTLDNQYSLSEDPLPEPRATEGWFDRLSVRRDKLRELQQQYRKKACEEKAALKELLLVFTQSTVGLSEKSISALEHSFLTSAHSELTFKENIYAQQAIPENLVPLLPASIQPPRFVPTLPGYEEDEHVSAIFFSCVPDPYLAQELHVIQGAANTDEITTTVQTPLMSTDASIHLHRWLVSEGDQIDSEQTVAELISEQQIIPVTSPCTGLVERKLAPEGTGLYSEQAILELKTN